MDAEDKEIEDKAVTIAAKQVSERLKSKGNSSFRGNLSDRTRGRYGRNYGRRNFT